MELCNLRSLLVAAIVLINCVTRTASRHHFKHNPLVGCDKCHECGRNGANCRTISGLLDTMDLKIGYNDILLVPQGAMSIDIAEVRPSENYLAIRAKNSSYYLNGDYHIVLPRSIVIAGTTWHYERNPKGLPSPDKLRCHGPTNEPLLLSLLLQEPNVGVEYEYSVPSTLALPPNAQYNWVHDEFSPCSAFCGGGIQTRNVTCRSREDLEVVVEQLCDILVKPDVNQSCNTQACLARWVEGPWSLCSKDCGQGGTRSRQVHCKKIIANSYPSIVVDNKECFQIFGPKPPLFEECNQYITCPIWFTGPWKPCNTLCGKGKQTRQVVCYQKTKGRVQVLSDDQCLEEKPSAEQPCLVQPCKGVDWVLSDWTGCDNCLSKVRSRTAVCVTEDQKEVNESFCGHHPTPILEEPCDRTKLPTCEVQWYATQWSKCSVECGTGVQLRRIFCSLFDGAGVMKVVADSRCDSATRYNDTKPCGVPNDKCPAKWFAGPWSECSVDCGTGVQSRHIFCGVLDAGVIVKVDDANCDNAARYNDTKPCNMPKDKICPSRWFAGPWSECPQECESGLKYRHVICLPEITFSKSGWRRWRADCHVDSMPDSMQFCNMGVCNADEIMPVSPSSTPLMDDYYDYEDCEEDAGYQEASVKEDTSISNDDKMSSGSPFTSAPWDWATAITKMVTKKSKCKRRVVKCTKTKFGCCPDKSTPAAGPFDKGCARPKSCSESKFGCCPDVVSQATGPNDRGCPTLPCAETLFGCCKSDNKTIAEGNDQDGCPLKIELSTTKGSGFSSTDTTFSTEQDWTMESGSTDETVDSTETTETAETEIDSTLTEVTELWNSQATSSIVAKPTTNKLFRSDYVYNKKTDAFYKLHTETASYEDADSICVVEGAALMMPSSPFDLSQVHGMLKQFPDIGDVAWVKAQTESSTSTPSDQQQCDVVTRKGEIETFHMFRCTDRLPFMCKIDAKNVIYNSECDVYNTGYAKAQNGSSCYKLPRKAYTWDQAYADCQSESAHLVIVNSQVERDVIHYLMNKAPRTQGTKTWWFFFIGFRAEPSNDGSPRVFKTIFNQTLEEAGYSTWMPNEPNNVNENCGAIFLNDGSFNDVECTTPYGFICEKEITKPNNLLSTERSGFSSTDSTFSTEQDWTTESGSTVETIQKQPYSSTETGERSETSSTEVDYTVTELSSLWNGQATSSMLAQSTTNKLFRSDYVYNKKTDAFYKLHTETESHENANSICVAEGAALMMPSSRFDLSQLHGMLKQFPDIGDFAWVKPLTESSTSNSPSSDQPQCDVVTRKGDFDIFDTYLCSKSLPFMCKIDAKKAFYNSECDVYNTGYAKPQNASSCYKLPRIAYTWDQAYADCQAEGAHLVILNSQAERDAIHHLINEAPRTQGTTAWWFFFVGFRAEPSTDGSPRMFKTIFNQTLEEAGYSTWMPNEPNNGNENCGAIFMNDGMFNDVECTTPHGFICEKEITKPNRSGFSSTDTIFSTEQDWIMKIGSTDEPVNSSTETGERSETSSTEVDSTVTEVTELSSFWNRQATSSIVANPTTNKLFRSDYVYNKKTDAFYKLHTETASHEDANSFCVVEGAALMIPSSPFDLSQVHGMLKQFPDFGDFAWVSNSTSTSPSDRQQCDVMTRKGEIETFICSKRLPFMCKIDAKKAIYNNECGVYNTGYAKAQNASSCYKLPRIAYTWDQAYADCQAEGAHLVILNSQAERDAIHHLINEAPRTQGTTAWWFFFAGFRAEPSTDGSPRVFKTIFNQTLEETGYSTWMPNEPNNGNENCGAIFMNDGRFNDVECTTPHGFICEKEITKLNRSGFSSTDTIFSTEQDWITKSGSTDETVNSSTETVERSETSSTEVDSTLTEVTEHSSVWNRQATTSVFAQPTTNKLYRSDYVYNNKTDAFYKLHTETARREDVDSVCAVEGAALMMLSSSFDLSQVHGMLKQFPDIGDFAWVQAQSENSTSTSPLDQEQCDVVTRKGEIKTYKCSERLPFMCKIDAKKAIYNSECDMYNTGYAKAQNASSCYKLPRIAYTWDRAYADCQADGAHMVILKSQAERDVIHYLINKAPRTQGTTTWWFFFAGFRAEPSIDGSPRVFKTIFNQTLEEAGYSTWMPNEPNNGNENCGAIFLNDGRFNDVECTTPYGFICEKEITKPNNDIMTVSPSTTPIMDDYVYVYEDFVKQDTSIPRLLENKTQPDFRRGQLHHMYDRRAQQLDVQ